MEHWLDKHIAEQAAFYGLSVKDHATLIGGAALYQEFVEEGGSDELHSAKLGDPLSNEVTS